MTNFQQNTIFNIINSFHMLLVMIISGHLAWKRTDNKPMSYLGRKFINLIIPFASWYVVCYGLIRVMNIVKSEFSQNNGIIDYLVRAVLNPNYGLWYLWVLSFNFCILYITKIRKISCANPTHVSIHDPVISITVGLFWIEHNPMALAVFRSRIHYK